MHIHMCIHVCEIDTKCDIPMASGRSRLSRMGLEPSLWCPRGVITCGWVEAGGEGGGHKCFSRMGLEASLWCLCRVMTCVFVCAREKERERARERERERE